MKLNIATFWNTWNICGPISSGRTQQLYVVLVFCLLRSTATRLPYIAIITMKTSQSGLNCVMSTCNTLKIRIFYFILNADLFSSLCLFISRQPVANCDKVLPHHNSNKKWILWIVTLEQSKANTIWCSLEGLICQASISWVFSKWKRYLVLF